MSDRLRLLFALLEPLYRDHPGWAAERGAIARVIENATSERGVDLRALDDERAGRPAWFGAPDMIGYSFYVDRFAGDLEGLRGRLPWLDALGIRMLHPLPITLGQSGDSDGGFAVADYRQVDPRLGTVDDVRRLAADLHASGMALTLDCVLNHCARDHRWAQAALAGDPVYRDYFRIVEDPNEVAAWEAGLDEVFPDTAPGNFTPEAALGGSVWTTFYPFQWDLDWSNPAVFREMLDVLLFWANQGVDAFRLDSSPYLWKRRGTTSRNLPETHRLVAALRAGLDAAAPGVALLAEAIERTAEVLPYLEPTDGVRACQLAYHNGLMAALWVALATGDPTAIAQLIRQTALVRPDTAWLTYLRCHDDIIWSALTDLVPPETLDTVSTFFTPGHGYSDGRSFQSRPGASPSTVGMLASLIGGDAGGTDAVRRYKLLLGAMLALPGMPMLYMGDEIGLPNHLDPAAPDDLRWLHRPSMDWHRADDASAGMGPGADFLAITRAMIAIRRSRSAFHAKAPARPIGAPPGILLIERGEADERVLLAANFGPLEVNLPLTDFRHDLFGGTWRGVIAAGAVHWLVP